MSLLFADSFDGVLVGASKWGVWSDNATVDVAYGRNGTKGMQFTHSGAGTSTISVPISPASNRVTCGAWVQRVSGDQQQNRILRLHTATSEAWVDWATGTNQLSVGFAASGAGSPIGPPGVGQALTWIFVELMWEPGVAIEVRANTETIYSATPGGSGTPNLFSIRASGGVRWFDDIYVLDSDGAVNNAFLGPIKIANLKPDGAGNRTELAPEPSGNNWERVSDGDDDTYVEGDPGDGDLYTFDDLPSSDDVLGVVQHYRAFDSAGGAITGRAIARVGGTEYDGDNKTMPGSAAAHVQPWDVNPDTGQPWTPAEVDGAEFGVEFA